MYDEEFDEKMSKEGSWACGIGIARQLTYVFALEGQAVFGKLAGSNSKSEFESNINEYSLQLTTDLVNMLIPDNNASLHPYIKFGIGQFNFNTRLKYYDPDKPDVKVKSASPEFVYMFGAGAFYIISNSFDANIEFLGRRMDNDRLDGSPNKDDNDYYSYLSVGMVYKINNMPRDVRYYKRLGMKSPLIRRR
jgi:opacity protein-like surface antigen